MNSSLTVLHIGLSDGVGGVANYAKSLVGIPNVRHLFGIDADSDMGSEFVNFPSSYGKSPFVLIKRIIELRYLIQKKGVDILHVHTLRAGFLGAIIRLLLPHQKVIYTGHGVRFDQLEYSPKKVVLFLVELLVINVCTKTVAIRLADYKILKRISFFRSRLHLIETRMNRPSQISRARRNDPARVLFVGSLFDIKNPVLFIEIIREYGKYFERKIEVEVLGDGPLMKYLESIDGSQDVKFRGQLRHDEILESMSRSQLLLITSRLETLPLVMIEALSIGVPVLINGFRYASSLVEPYSATLNFIYNSSEDACRKMDYILNNWDEMSNKASVLFSRYEGKEKFIQSYIRVYGSHE